ncbi:glycoside hydrolase family 97 protein [Tamlana sp. I1]|uniref:glycoside hydrolase family 97 protein n=1 Tax=Tamlana sp. I1 TaxID=2762061 RepID=UPI00188FD3CD|nr:glycoside hydrolase family 97 protein [Tamlana sp. I1]
MNNRSTLALIVLILFTISCSQKKSNSYGVNSPDGKIGLMVSCDNANGNLSYHVSFNDSIKITESLMGFVAKQEGDLMSSWSVVNDSLKTFSETWTPVLGRLNKVKNNYNELSLDLIHKLDHSKKMVLRFRVFNDGIGFRYEIPEWSKSDSLYILEESTEFNFKNDSEVLWSSAHFTQYQKPYHHTKISEIDSSHTPITVRDVDGTLLAIHQAAIKDYPDMKLQHVDGAKLRAHLTPWKKGPAVKAAIPFNTPWRTIQITDNTESLLKSYLIENLNEPLALENTDYIKPYKYMGIWWEMHIGTHTWSMDDRHGATTARTKKLIDFAAEHGIDAVLAEGWNVKEDIFAEYGDNLPYSFTKAASDFDLEDIVSYAKHKGVDFIIHNETLGKIFDYETQLDSAYTLYKKIGITGMKTGYSGALPGGEWRHGQFMSKHYEKVIKKAAEYELMVNAHEPIIPSGLDRTYPNYVTSEAVRGSEMEAWSDGNPVGHPVHLAYTRLLAGPMDYTPGIFDIKLKRFAKEKVIWHPKDDGLPKRIHTTLSAQLALYVVLYSPWQMVADLPENYEGEKAFEFIEEVPTVWDDVKVLSDDFGKHIVIARKKGDNWYIGGVNGVDPVTTSVALSFLDSNATYKMKKYADGEETDYENSPEKYEFNERMVSQSDALQIKMVKGGGFAVSLTLIDKTK